MEERMAAEKSRAGGAESETSPAGRIRVTDRRRFNTDNQEESREASAEGRGAEPEGLKAPRVEELEALTRVAEQKAADVQVRFEQLRAELRRETDETRQRLNRAADERAAREKAAFVAALLPVIDNLQRAMDAAEAGGSLETLMDGLRGTVSGFESALAGAGVELIEADGQPFDPELHEAVDVAEVEPERDGLVTAQYSRGYRLGGQLLRPARVQVGRAGGAAQGVA
ncbi:MAG: nucleotide exchange factor GrpE [Acidobacteria bacterium]|nr:nucleotide exchange factor GrpE [Acidobacteriota bacterium]